MSRLSKENIDELSRLVNEDIVEEIKDGYGKYYNKYGVLIYDGNFKDGKPSGRCKYYIAESLAYDGEWVEGKYHGYGKEYEIYLIYEGEFKKGYYDGKGKLYFENGQVWLEGEFNKGYLVGNGKEYYESGAIRYLGNFKDSKYNGKGKFYNENRTLIYEGDFKEGKFSGSGKLFGGHGNIKSEGQFMNNKYMGNSSTDLDYMKAIQLMDYIESRGEKVTGLIKPIINKIQNKKSICDEVIFILKDIKNPRTQLLVARAYSIKGAEYRKNSIQYLEEFLSNENLQLEDFSDDPKIFDGRVYRKIRNEIEDKEFIDKTIRYLREQIEEQLLRNYLAEKMYDKLENYINRISRLGLATYENYIVLAESYSKQKDYDKAEVYYKKALELSSTSDIVHKNIAEIYLKKYNDVDKAIEYLDGVEETRVVKIMKVEYRKRKEQGYIYNGRWKRISKYNLRFNNF